MIKIKNDANWRKCGLCGKSIDNGEECWEIQYKKKINWYKVNYRTEHWHLRHFVFSDYSASCKTKMECITGNEPSKNLGCQKRLCTHYK